MPQGGGTDSLKSHVRPRSVRAVPPTLKDNPSAWPWRPTLACPRQNAPSHRTDRFARAREISTKPARGPALALDRVAGHSRAPCRDEAVIAHACLVIGRTPITRGPEEAARASP